MKKFIITLCLLSFSLIEGFGAQATLKEFSGDLRIIHLFKRLSPEVGMELSPKDMVVTEANGKAVLTLPDDSEVSIGPDSRFKLTKLDVPNDKTRDVELELIEGASLFNVKHMEDTNFYVRTPTAVAGVRGTNFMVKHRRMGRHFQSSIAVLRGLVAVSPLRRNMSKTVHAILLRAMMRSNVSSGSAPSAAETMNAAEVEGLAGEVGLAAASGGAAGAAGVVTNFLESIGVDTSVPITTIIAPKIVPVVPKVDTSKIIQTVTTVKEIAAKRIPTPPSPPTNPNAQ